MKQYNVILISMDAVRHDYLGTYGNKIIKTPNIDRVAQEGVVFENATAASCLTPIAHGTILSGNYPHIHNVRDPFSYLESKIISEILKDQGYDTAGFVSVGFLSAIHGFGKGFDYYNEPREEGVWGSKHYVSEDEKEEMSCLQGNLWREDMFDWLKKHSKEKFFIFGHYFECHWGMETQMLEEGMLVKDHLPENCYYGAKIEFMDKYLIGPMTQLLQQLDLWEDTIVILTADHGENLGEHEVPPPYYPQHRTVYECDMRIPLMIKSPTFPKNKRIKGLVSSADIVPTLYEILGVKGVETEGQSLVDAVNKGEAKNIVAYSEELYSRRGYGDFQAMKSDTYKYIIDRRINKEEFYNLIKDPEEKNNFIGKLTAEEVKLKDEWREKCDYYLNMKKEKKITLTEEQKKKIEDRLSNLGYF